MIASTKIPVKLQVPNKQGKLVAFSTALEYAGDRIFFHGAPFALKAEISAMKGSKWHGHVKGDGRKLWSVANCPHNQFQIDYLTGRDVYSWFERPLEAHAFRPQFKQGEPREIRWAQRDMADALLTYHYQILAAEMRVGKTLGSTLAMEASNCRHWWWVGPARTLINAQREFDWWEFDSGRTQVEWMSYEGLVARMRDRRLDDPLPGGVIFDEGSRLKSSTSHRAQAAQALTDAIRERYGFEGFAAILSGTPAPKSPLDIWPLAEIIWPGFLREGSPAQLEKRLAFLSAHDAGEGRVYHKRHGWRDDDRKCDVCGQDLLSGDHELDGMTEPGNFHKFKRSVNEVSYLNERLQGILRVYFAKDCLDLPPVTYEEIALKSTPATLRVARAIVATSDTAAQAFTLLCELSDGFQYQQIQRGVQPCDHCTDGTVPTYEDGPIATDSEPCPVCNGSREMPRIVREARQVPCPKDQALLDKLEECDETGRIVVFAAFTGAIDRCTTLCQRAGWHVVRCDGRGMLIFDHNHEQLTGSPLDYWSDMANARVAFVAHPESGGMGFTLPEARVEVWWSNSSKPEYRIQGEARIWAPTGVVAGKELPRGGHIVDLIHLPSDRRKLEIIRDNRRLELMTLGEAIGGCLNV